MRDPSGELAITGVVQREAWLQRAMPPAEQLGQDLWSLPVTETAAPAHLLERRSLVTASRTRPPAYTARAA